MSMQVKATVAYSEKMGTPNYGSIGAQCGVDIEITPDDLAAGKLQEEIRLGFDACRQAVKAELARQLGEPPSLTQPSQPPVPPEPESIWAGMQTPQDMADMLLKWSKEKPIGQFKEKWAPLLEEAKEWVNKKVDSGAWTDFDVVVRQIKALAAQLDTAKQGEIAF